MLSVPNSSDLALTSDFVALGSDVLSCDFDEGEVS